MNFNIVDGDNGYRELLPVFSEMYNDKQIRVAEILKENDWDINKRDEIVENRSM